MTPRAHMHTTAPTLEGKYFKFKLINFLANPAPQPSVVMHMRKPGQRTRVFVPEPATAVDEAHTPVDALPAPPPAAGSEIHPVINQLYYPERPESPEEVTGLIKRLSLAGASDGGGGGSVTASDRGAAADHEFGTSKAVTSDSWLRRPRDQPWDTALHAERCSRAGRGVRSPGWRLRRSTTASVARSRSSTRRVGAGR